MTCPILSLILSPFRVLSPFRSAFYPHSVPRFIPIPFRVLSPFRSAFPFRVLSPFRSAFPFRSAIPVPRFIPTPKKGHQRPYLVHYNCLAPYTVSLHYQIYLVNTNMAKNVYPPPVLYSLKCSLSLLRLRIRVSHFSSGQKKSNFFTGSNYLSPPHQFTTSKLYVSIIY